MTDKSSFASRWSQRKRDVKVEELDEVQVEVDGPAEELPERTDEEILAEFNLKDPDEMKEGDDFSAFMNSAIPQRLKNRALRKLWLSNPALANLDQLVDYGEDFSDTGAMVENIATAYKVGKGYLEKFIEEEDVPSESPNEENPTEDVEVEVKVETAPATNVRKPEGIRAKSALPAESKIEVLSDDITKPAKNSRKRMKFEF